MRESDTYQAILDEGREEGFVKGRKEGFIEGIQRALLHQGRKRFGEPDDATRRALLVITDLDRLDRLTDRLLEVPTWQKFLETP
jgi:predicted transposase YdaD